MIVFCITMMLLKNNFSLPALLITLFHGSYGIIWVFKDTVFPDKSFKIKITYLAGFITSVSLTLYSSMAYVITSDSEYKKISVDRFLCAGFCYIFGVVLMIITDAQKTFTLQIKKGLINNGVFAWTRNPNYLGEISLYLAFGILAQSYFCYIYLIYVWISLFWSRMYNKDLSLCKKEGWKLYSQNSYMLLPKLFSQNNMNYIFYSVLGVCFCYLYCSGGLLNNIIESRNMSCMIGW